jgi:septin 3/9/12
MRDRYIQDTRIHCCLYFINPTGHALRPIDVIVMKKLSEVVNVVPVIAKSDSLTLDEREKFKAKIREELVYHNIRLYPFDTDENDEEEVQLNESIRVYIVLKLLFKHLLTFFLIANYPIRDCWF